ncbi:hypothetical protein E1B28_003436 [Marasmius oreades]|uniref:Cytochrome P450 n=1 Tax=Marasmius oreades TaxID=181124 RepID=A0A9P7RLY4_9AGAR|nr:uncharacterized protein E1B28_003436 [Marasmius oreades]KAG7085902.1 hypothetical protein E1B28_003436 [Marasmius oreades]
MFTISIWIPLAIFSLALSLRLRRRNALNVLRGPSSPSYLFGFEHDIQGAKIMHMLYEWSKEYGTAYMLPLCFGEKVLVLSDPRAIHAVLNDSVYSFPETGDLNKTLNMAFGKGVIWATGENHKRHRRILSPAFSINHIKGFLPLFHNHVAHLSEKWNIQLQGKSQTFDIVPWVHKLALDILGESSLNYRFNALDNEPNELTKALHDLETTEPVPSKMTTLKMSLERRIPPTIASLKAKYFPSPKERVSQRYMEVSHAKGREVMEGLGSSSEGLALADKDILSLLVRANAAEDWNKRLTDEEVTAQISTLLQAGHHTTGYMIAWVLYELATHPKDQANVYEEIKRVREKNGGEILYTDYDSMNYLTSVIKEVLRLYPILPTLERTASKNALLPLDFHVISPSGNRIDNIPVGKGQRIIVDAAGYNRLESVWGDDPQKWNPSRHEHIRLQGGNKTASVGLFANLLSFSSGPKGCIGWRFALMEIQVAITGLLKKYEFRLPPEVEIDPITTFILVPSVKGKEMEGPQLPLTVTPRLSAFVDSAEML